MAKELTARGYIFENADDADLAFDCVHAVADEGVKAGLDGFDSAELFEQRCGSDVRWALVLVASDALHDAVRLVWVASGLAPVGPKRKEEKKGAKKKTASVN